MRAPTIDQYDPTVHEPGSGGPLILTGDEQLAEHLLKLCAAVGAEPQLLATAPPRRLWEAAPIVLLGDDQYERCAELPRRPGVLLLSGGPDHCEVWVRGVQLGAEQVLFLPDAQSWLLDRIADVVEGVGPPALTVAVLGGRGGAGASTLACALAVAAVRAGHRTMLIDGDPLGGGLDVLLGGEGADGLRWPDLADARGRVNSAELAQALPVLHRISTLSWDRGAAPQVPSAAMRCVLEAARRRGGLVVLDLPRQLDPVAVQALEQTDTGLLVIPAEVRALAAAGRVAATAGARLADLRAVIRQPGPVGLRGAEIARGLGLPLAGEITHEAGLTLDAERGRPPGQRSGGPLARFCAAYLNEVLPGTEGATAS
ncbi:CpaE-like family protein [Kitasatospora sp. NBC_01287]|uniref:septum site-determining protein Ssd n=1 Tax=Kitasatospora sp. NBC_01287 TaxID=2903573 RepID=UPI0022581344|nr:septum site-determining protein Ssd [Kitasatospora sp. NBC_01287]MCX4748123.1 CpaE-like family protein [Kitasatospora sp. NBC_01287]